MANHATACSEWVCGLRVQSTQPRHHAVALGPHGTRPLGMPARPCHRRIPKPLRQGRTGLVPPLSPSPLAAGASDPVYGVCTTAGAGADRGRAGSTPVQPNHTRPQPDTPGGDAGRASESTTTPFPLCVSYSPGSTCIPCRADGKKELELPCAGAAGGALRTGYHPAGRVDTPASPVRPPPGGQLGMELT